MYENSALSLKYEQLIREKKSSVTELKSRIESTVLTLRSLEKNYMKYQKNLLPLMKKSYDFGEISAVEYILTRQQSYQFKEKIYNAKKAYYNMLFKLYTLSENKDHI
jgi:outer membrane protein TolC